NSLMSRRNWRRACTWLTARLIGVTSAASQDSEFNPRIVVDSLMITVPSIDIDGRTDVGRANFATIAKPMNRTTFETGRFASVGRPSYFPAQNSSSLVRRQNGPRGGKLRDGTRLTPLSGVRLVRQIDSGS